MSHDKDHDHPVPGAPPRDPPPHESKPCPDRKRREHPDVVPREPVDPKSHPSRHGFAPLRARPA